LRAYYAKHTKSDRLDSVLLARLQQADSLRASLEVDVEGVSVDVMFHDRRVR
jgi:hypothetical protein